MLVPDRLSSAVEAAAAIREYLAWHRPDAEKMAAVLGLQPFAVLPHWQRRRLAEYNFDQLVGDLRTHPGPGPAVAAHRPGDEPRIIGRPSPDRPTIRVTEPVAGEYGLEVVEPLPELVELVTNIESVRLLAARAAVCAQSDRDRGGRNRQAEQLEAEADALNAYAVALEGYIPELSAHFLDVWRGEAAARPAPEPAKPTNVLTRSAELRRPSK